MKNFVSIILLAYGITTNGQSLLKCAIQPLNKAQRLANQNKIAQLKRAGRVLNSITYLPIKVHVIREDNDFALADEAAINNMLANANRDFLRFGIQFYYCETSIDYRNNTEYTTSKVGLPMIYYTNNAINLFLLKFISATAAGYAAYPNPDPRSNQIVIDWNYIDNSSSHVFRHEMGHYLNLSHTHEDWDGEELVTRGNGANCTIAGDMICDTPADPYLKLTTFWVDYDSNGDMIYVGKVKDANGELYSPMLKNVMSYYWQMPSKFTEGQGIGMKDGVLLRLQGGEYNLKDVQYNLTCPPESMTPPSGLSVQTVGNSTALSWRDNTTTEIGYIVERSDGNNTTFLPIVGLSRNITSFVDNTTRSGITYYYRVKPSNTINLYSNVGSATVAGSCPTTQNFTVSANSGIQIFSASNTISSTSSISGTSTIVAYRAGSKIVLNQGFKVASGSCFKAILQSCSANARQSLETEVATEDNENVIDNFICIYPNPSENQITFSYDLEDSGTVNLSLTDSQGYSIIKSKNMMQSKGTNQTHFDISDLPYGLYLYKWQFKDKIHSGRFIKAEK